MSAIEQAFALKDNPFTLEKSLPLDVPNALRDLLATAPLQMAMERRLLPYYCDQVYPLRIKTKSTPFQTFHKTTLDLGYNDNPKTMDSRGRSRIFLIRGPAGSGKTTLAHRMIRWLMECASEQDQWKYVSWSPSSKNDNVLEQSKSIATKFKNAVLEKGNGRFLCLLEDVVSPADIDILQVFLDLLQGRIQFFFITSYDEEIRAKAYNGTNPLVTVYETDTLTPQQAVVYLRHRFPPLRTEKPPEWMVNYPIFPFTDEIVKESLSEITKTVSPKPSPIALRQLNVLFSQLLDDRRLELEDLFDIARIDSSDAVNYLIHPLK